MSYISVDDILPCLPQDIWAGTSLDSAITQIQTVMDNWLGRTLEVIEYQEILQSNSAGIALLSHYPVVSVYGLSVLIPNTNPVVYQQSLINAIWNYRDRRLYVGDINVSIQVNYTAGYNPVPAIVKTVFIDLLKFAVKQGSFDISLLYAPVQDVQSTSLAGLSQSFRLGNTTSATMLDRLLQPLSRYRRKFITRTTGP